MKKVTEMEDMGELRIKVAVEVNEDGLGRTTLMGHRDEVKSAALMLMKALADGEGIELGELFAEMLLVDDIADECDCPGCTARREANDSGFDLPRDMEDVAEGFLDFLRNLGKAGQEEEDYSEEE